MTTRKEAVQAQNQEKKVADRLYISIILVVAFTALLFLVVGGWYHQAQTPPVPLEGIEQPQNPVPINPLPGEREF